MNDQKLMRIVIVRTDRDTGESITDTLRSMWTLVDVYSSAESGWCIFTLEDDDMQQLNAFAQSTDDMISAAGGSTDLIAVI